jgi:hypothetical protein
MALHGIDIKPQKGKPHADPGEPAERKRATFAANARKWKHGKAKPSTSSKLYGAKK